MKESISNSYLFSIVIIIVGICSTLIMVSINYSKVFKMKNRMIEIIERYGTYNSTVEGEIDNFLRSSGYPPYTYNSRSCPIKKNDEISLEEFNDTEKKDLGLEPINKIHSYKYCIYSYKTVKGMYYSVTLFMSFEFPVIGDYLRIEVPMYGDTKIIFDY